MIAHLPDPYPHCTDNHHYHIYHKINSLIGLMDQAMEIVAQDAAQLAPSGDRVRWVREEIDKLVDFLHEHHSEGTDARTFKDMTFKAALAHIRPFLKSGTRPKTLQSIKYQWRVLKNTHGSISTWCAKSGVHWDNERGANIEGTVADDVFDTFVEKNAPMASFRNQGWPYLEKMDDILPGTGNSGFSSYCPVNTSGGASSIDNTSFAPGSSVASPPSSSAVSSSSVLVALPPSSSTMPSSPSNSMAPPQTMPAATSSTGRSGKKHALSMAPPDEMAGSAISSTHSRKRSCVSGSQASASSNRAVAGRNWENPTRVALHAVDSSIRHLNNSLSNNFVNPLKTVQDAIVQISKQEDMPLRYRQFLVTQISANPTIAAVYNALPTNEARLTFATDLYQGQHPEDSGPSSSSM